MKAQIELKRDLGLWSAAAIVVGTVIGSGVFLVASDMAQALGSVAMIFVVWVFGGMLSLFGALTYAELAAAMPEAGGEYVYLRAAYGPLWSFIYGWTQMWVAKSGSVATLATAFFLYFGNFFPQLENPFCFIPLPFGSPLEIRYSQLCGIVLILILGGINYLGVKIGGDVQVVVTVVKVALIFFVIAVGLGFGHSHAAAAVVPKELTSAGFFAALVAALWAYDGWNNVSMVASEVREPTRNLPLALIWGTISVIVIYLLANAAYFYVLSHGEVAASNRVAGDMMGRVLGPWGANAVAIAAMISIFAALNGSILTGSRVPYAMARDGLFIRSFGTVHPQFRTPGISILGLSAWSALILLSGRYKQLYTCVIFASWILYGMTTAAVIVLRRKLPDMPRPYRTWGYPIVPVLFVLSALFLVLSTLINSPRESVFGLVIIFIGLPFYFHWKNRKLR
jgi:basic amino acid/polyamine antiporter, APA family